jgi:hypothetical protein
MWGGHVSLAKREWFCAANTTETAVMAGQKILFSGRASIPLKIAWASDGLKKLNNGNTITAKAHPTSGMSAHLSSIGAEH